MQCTIVSFSVAVLVLVSVDDSRIDTRFELQVMNAALHGRDVYVLMPTGGMVSHLAIFGTAFDCLPTT